jgi:Excreted virulence factor EspC, type VII ESX diderm
MAGQADGYQVHPASLDQHAGTLDAVAKAVVTAADAVRTVTFDQNAYGVFCQAIPAMLQPLQTQIGDAVQAQAQQVGEAAGGVRDTSAAYRDVETAASAGFQRLSGPAG